MSNNDFTAPPPPPPGTDFTVPTVTQVVTEVEQVPVVAAPPVVIAEPTRLSVEPQAAYTAAVPAAPSVYPVAAPAAVSPLPFDLIANERLIKSYELARGRHWFTNYVSFLWVTDSRLIYANEYKAIISKGRSFNEIQISKVNGVVAKLNIGWRMGWLIFGVILALVGLPLIMVYGLGLILIALGILCIIHARQPVSELIVRADEGSYALEVGVDNQNLVKSGQKAAATATWALDPNRADTVTRELGALVLDIQARGALAGQ